MKKILLVASLFSGTALFSQTWTTIASGTTAELKSVHFPSASIGFAVGLNGTILKTTDGGTTWQSMTADYSGYWFWDVQFLDNNTGFVGGESDAGSNPSGSAIVLKTVDGGTTWTEVYSSNAHPIRDIFVVNNNVIYASGGAESIMGAESKIVKSADGGLTWSQAGPSYPGNGNAGVIIGGMFFLDATNGFMGTYDFLDQAYWSSTNNGATSLTRVVISNSIGYWNFATDFPENSVGYMTRSTYAGDPVHLRKTVDGGATWSENTISGANNTYGLDFIDAGLGYIVGDAGNIMKTTDGGTTWITENSGTTQSLRSVCFVNSSLGFAVGGNGTILKYTTGAAVLSMACGPNQTIVASQQGNSMPNIIPQVTANTTCAGGSISYSQSPAAATSLNNGANTVTVTATDMCGNTETCQMVVNFENDLGVDNLTLESLTLFPNPVTDLLMIDCVSLSESINIEMYDSFGKLVMSSNNQVNTLVKMDISKLAKGVYQVVLISQDSKSVKQFIKVDYRN